MMREGYSWPILILGIVRFNMNKLDRVKTKPTVSSLPGFSYCLQVSIL